MALATEVLNAGVDGATAIVGWAAIHDGPTSADQVSNERVAIVWDPATGAVAASGAVPLAFTGTPSGPATHLGVWSQDQPGGTFRGAAALTGDQTFNAAGEYSVTAATLTGTDQTA